MDERVKLENALRTHDWFYERTEDPSKYRRGTQQRDEIRNIMNSAKEQGWGEEAEEMYNQYKRV